ncbi:MAG: hypothetical protein K9G76_01915 [Bacteroidales bacterium]|nr:hypothetical protein [Bacteroidales bacterium]
MESSISFPRVFIGGLLAFMLHGAALTGIMFIWQRKRYGLYIIGFSSLLIIVLSYVFGYGSLTGTLIYFSTFIIFLPFLKKLT